MLATAFTVFGLHCGFVFFIFVAERGSVMHEGFVIVAYTWYGTAFNLFLVSPTPEVVLSLPPKDGKGKYFEKYGSGVGP